jgi:hypothetical protein
VVGKRSVLPRGTRLGRNVKVGGDVRTSDFRQRVYRSGSTVERTDKRAAAGGVGVMEPSAIATNGVETRNRVGREA